MPGYTIHTAIAKQYLKKHKGEIKNEEEFLKGNFAPDITDDKYKSHYNNYSRSHVGLMPFLEQEEIDYRNTDFGKGYFLHLLADELFYYHVFLEETEYVRDNNLNFYHDYDCLNYELKGKYGITKVNKEFEKFVRELNEEPEFLKLDRVEEFIENLSAISLETQIEEIKKTGNPKI